MKSAGNLWSKGDREEWGEGKSYIYRERDTDIDITAGCHLLVILKPVLQLLRNNTNPEYIRVRFIPPNFTHLSCLA